MSQSYDGQWSHKASIIRLRGSKYQVETNFNKKRERWSFDTLAKARAYAGSKSIEIANLGVAAFDLPRRERENAVEAMKVLKGETPLAKAPGTPLPIEGLGLAPMAVLPGQSSNFSSSWTRI